MSVAVRARDYSKTAFDDVLQHHFNALLSFACQSDFSGENLVFFHLIQEWKAAWMTNRNNSPAQMTAKRRCNKCLQRQLFNVGVEIFYDFIDPETARFALNLDHSLSASLRSIFRPAVIAMRVSGTQNVIAPFNDFESSERNYSSTTFLSSFSRYFHVEWSYSPSIQRSQVYGTEEMVITDKSM